MLIISAKNYKYQYDYLHNTKITSCGLVSQKFIQYILLVFLHHQEAHWLWNHK